MSQVAKFNPKSLAPPPENKHAHVVIAPAGGRTAYLAGQVALDVDGNVIGPGKHYEQTVQVFKNISDTLTEIGAKPDQIVEMTIIVVDYKQAIIDDINRAGDVVFGQDWPATATTLIGAQALGHDAFLVEVKAIVALYD